MIAAANHIRNKPYKWGGGHGSWNDSGYDCSGSVSYALHGGRLLRSPARLERLHALGSRRQGPLDHRLHNPSHAFMVVAGLRFDTSMTAGNGPGWSKNIHAERLERLPQAPQGSLLAAPEQRASEPLSGQQRAEAPRPGASARAVAAAKRRLGGDARAGIPRRWTNRPSRDGRARGPLTRAVLHIGPRNLRSLSTRMTTARQGLRIASP